MKMAKRQRVSAEEILKRLTDLEEDKSGDESEGSDCNSSDAGLDVLQVLTSSDSSEDDISDSGPRVAALTPGHRLAARDGTEWTIIDFTTDPLVTTTVQNVFEAVPGPTAYSRNHVKANQFSSSFNLLITTEMLQHIQQCTEAEAYRVLGGNSHWKISIFELRAFIGLLFIRGALGYNMSLDMFWSENYGLPIFGDTMNRRRFKEILKFLRFDVRTTRSERLKTDKFALISEIWNSFIDNCQKCYTPSCNLTIDEQLCPSKARGRFVQRRANKRDKFGIKFWMLTEADSKYLVNGIPYVGETKDLPVEGKLPESVVIQLMSPLYGKGYNVTCDSFFTSSALARKLTEEKTSLVGSLQPNRKEIPDCLRHTHLERYSSVIMKNQHGHTLTCYQCKKRKKMFIYSTLHDSSCLQDSGKKKPETVLFYNNAKCRTDSLDRICRNLSIEFPSRRWPVQVFFKILDLAGINSWILHENVTKAKISRRRYLLSLAEELIQSYILEKRPIIGNFWQRGLAISGKRKQCQIGFCKNNKSNKICFKCGKTVCGKCGQSVTIINCKKCIA